MCLSTKCKRVILRIDATGTCTAMANSCIMFVCWHVLHTWHVPGMYLFIYPNGANALPRVRGSSSRAAAQCTTVSCAFVRKWASSYEISCYICLLSWAGGKRQRWLVANAMAVNGVFDQIAVLRGRLVTCNGKITNGILSYLPRFAAVIRGSGFS